MCILLKISSSVEFLKSLFKNIFRKITLRIEETSIAVFFKHKTYAKCSMVNFFDRCLFIGFMFECIPNHDSKNIYIQVGTAKEFGQHNLHSKIVFTVFKIEAYYIFMIFFEVLYLRSCYSILSRSTFYLALYSRHAV